MTRTEIPGSWYIDALPTGEYAAVALDGSVVHTHLGAISALDGCVPTQVRVTTMGGFRFAGQSNKSSETLVWVQAYGWQPIPTVACGVNAVIYDAAGSIHISNCSVGSQGWRYYGILGPSDQTPPRLITGDETIRSSFGLTEWTYLGDSLWIGQGAADGGILVYDGARLRVLETGWDMFIRANRIGDDVAVAFYISQGTGRNTAVILQATMQELRQLPLYVPDPPPPPSPDPVEPTFGPFTHPILVVPFKDPEGATTALAEILVNMNNQMTRRPCIVAEDTLGADILGPVLGVYTEDEAGLRRVMAKAGDRRVILCHDALTDVTPNPYLRSHDQVWIELYRYLNETLATAADRWHRQALNVISWWRGDMGVVPMFYCMGGPRNGIPPEVWTEQQVLDTLAYLTGIVNLSSQIKIVAPFEYLRANGMSAHPVLYEAFKRLMAAVPMSDGKPIWPSFIAQAPPTPPKPVPVPKYDGSALVAAAYVQRGGK